MPSAPIEQRRRLDAGRARSDRRRTRIGASTRFDWDAAGRCQRLPASSWRAMRPSPIAAAASDASRPAPAADGAGVLGRRPRRRPLLLARRGDRCGRHRRPLGRSAVVRPEARAGRRAACGAAAGSAADPRQGSTPSAGRRPRRASPGNGSVRAAATSASRDAAARWRVRSWCSTACSPGATTCVCARSMPTASWRPSAKQASSTCRWPTWVWFVLPAIPS